MVESDPVLAAMTVNERLFHVGALEEWDAALRRHDRNAMIEPLQRVQMPDPEVTVDLALNRPRSRS